MGMKKSTLVPPVVLKPSKDVSLTLRNLPITDCRTKVRIRLSGGANDSKFHKPASQLQMQAGRFNVISKGKGAVARTNYNKASGPHRGAESFCQAYERRPHRRTMRLRRNDGQGR